MRRLIAVAIVALAALVVAAPVQANYLRSVPRYTTPSGRECYVGVETNLYDMHTYFFALEVVEDTRNSCGYISGTGFNYPWVWNHNNGQEACAWSNTRQDPAAGFIINTYTKTVCRGAPAYYRSRHSHGINLYGGARWYLPAGCHRLETVSSLVVRDACVNGDRTQIEINHFNLVWVQ